MAWAALVLLAVPGWANACLWDTDTLQQERMRFPTALELIAGKFLRHSPEFYEWRARDREARIKADPSNLPLYDDLAVAYSKTGRYELAVATMLKKEAIHPGLYETYSNLGTFHVLAGEFEKGLPYIDKALAINPDAHFGREKYQKWLVEYAMPRRKDGKLTFPVRDTRDPEKPHSFAEFLAKKPDNSRSTHERPSHEEVQAAVKGVLGMMRFADYDNPLLLEALADLLAAEPGKDWISDAKRMAARAYLHASYFVTDPAAKAEYRRLAGSTIVFQTATPQVHDSLPLEKLEADFKKELAEAGAWYAEVKAKELEWIRDGKNPEAEFTALYAAEPEFPPDLTPPYFTPWRKAIKPLLVGGGALLLLACLGLRKLRRMRAARRAIGVGGFR